MCLVNGRVTPEFDNFTCLNNRGHSVVNYCIIQSENIDMCKKCVDNV